MTRPEFSNNRSLDFSHWIRNKLPDSATGYMVTNQDWVLWNYKTRKLMFLEEKTHVADLARWFGRLINEVLDPALKDWCPAHNIDYLGYHIIKFLNTSPDNGLIFFDEKGITEEELVRLLSF